jgi:hypothetical protein
MLPTTENTRPGDLARDHRCCPEIDIAFERNVDTDVFTNGWKNLLGLPHTEISTIFVSD